MEPNAEIPNFEESFDMKDEEDMDPQMDIKAIEDIMWLEDEEFETAVKQLDLRSILCLMEALQTSMCEEQLQFEQLSRQLQKYPDRNSYNHRKISTALCTTQSLLTNLCTKHMICSGQRSLRSSFGDERSTVDTTPIVQVHKMSSGTLQNGGDRSSGFRESLRFFQNQVDQVDVIQSTTKYSSQKTNGLAKSHSFGGEKYDKANSKTNKSAPSVDNILSSVKDLCSSRNVKNVSETKSVLSSTSHSTVSDDSKLRNNLGSVIYQTSNMRLSGYESGVTRSEQIVSVSQKSVGSDNTRKQSLLSNFNPSLEFGESDQIDSKNNEVPGNCKVLPHSKSNLSPQTVNTSRKFLDSENSTVSQSESVFSKVNSSSEKGSTHSQSESVFNKVSKSSSKTVSDMANGNGVSNAKSKDSFVQENKKVFENKKEVVNASNRTFGQCKDKLSQMEFNKTSTSPLRNIQLELTDHCEQTENDTTQTCSVKVITKEEDSLSEKYAESDYDSHDFVVHKATFPEDYLEAMSEDNYSSVNEEYEVEHPNDPDIPSPDYPSDEEEYLVQHSDAPQYEDVEFIDNSAQYINDPRRYVYYPDDKELEVIPEEDEDDIEDDEIYNEVYNRGSFQISNPSSEDSRYNNHGECDSGLTDDQRSSSSTAEECDIEDDTDSAKGSLPLQDSSTESPTYNDRANMFQNVEYHKSNKRQKDYPTKRIIEDYEKPKLKGKDVETVPNTPPQNGTDTDDLRQVRSVSSSWDPKKLLEVLYRLDTPVEPAKKDTRYINKEGYLDKLPSGRKKATYWNPWKTKYIKLKDGFLQCFDNNRSEKPSMALQLMGGRIDTLENKMLGVDDQKGHYVVLRCSDDDETESWENALRSQCAEDFVNAYTSPCLRPLPINKNVIIIDLGSCSVRAGILMAQPSLPKLFIPTVCASSRSSHKKVFGIDALKPANRKDSQLTFPLHPSAKVTKYSIDVSILPDLLKFIFQELNVYPEDYKVQLSMPRNLSLQTKLKIARLLLDDFRVKGINLTHQAILSLHAYNSKSGIIVDIGDRLDVIPIIEGYIVESGVTRLPYGGQRMIHHLKHTLAEKNISLVSDVETYLARYVLEQLCYVAEDYNEELQRFHTNPDDFEMSISTSHFFEDECLWNEVILDIGRFHVPEGLFVPEKWGLDNPGLHKLVHHAIQECGVDLRREMTRSIYVSGGLTLLPGFVERLENEVDKLTPNTVTPKVHASAYRYHMSYIGACQIALEEKFDDVCITKQMWRKEGNTCVKKWHI